MECKNLAGVISDAVGTDELASLLCADRGWKLGVYWTPGGEVTVEVGPSIGDEIDPSERPFATVESDGIGNIDMTWWRTDLDGEEEMTDEEVIAESCENGDVSGELADLHNALIRDAQRTWGDRFESFPADGNIVVRPDGEGGLLPETWCVCGRLDSSEPWELLEADLDSLEAAKAWLCEHFADDSDYLEFYLDRELNDGFPELHA